MEVGLCLCALNAALANTGHIPEIFNTDQGCQFTSTEWTSRLLELDVRISMDGKGRWMDNVFIERLRRSVKYEEIYLHEHATIPVLEAGLNRWFNRYNTWRPHQALGNLTPQVVYENRPKAPSQPTPLRGLLRLPFQLPKIASCPKIHTSSLPPTPRRSKAVSTPLS